MATIPDHIMAELRERVDITEVIGKHVALKRSGKQFKGLCPFHEERTPSFYVDQQRGSFKCFGCSAWGDAIDFVQRVEGRSFPDAVRMLAASISLALPDQNAGDVARMDAEQAKRDAAYALNKLAAEVYREMLVSGEKGETGRDYQRERGINEETAERFQLGYAPDPGEAGWDTLTRVITEKKLSLELAVELGLAAKSDRSGKHYDRFRGRLMFPIMAPGGAVVGFSARVLPKYELDAEGQKLPKYVNSPETVLYKKSKQVFGLHAASQHIRSKGQVLIVEGNVDVVAMHQRGYTHCVAPLGTALTAHQCALIARFADRATLCFDGDRAGAKAMYAALPLLLDAGFDTRIAQLPEGEDPDSIDPDRLVNLLERPIPALEWFMRKMVAAGATESIEARSRAVRALVPLLRKVKGRDAKGDYAVLAANLLGVPVRRIWAALEGNSADRRSQQPPFVTDSAPMHAQPLPRAQVALTALLVDHPELARVADRAGVNDRVQDPRLAPILGRVLEATLKGEAQPGEGELLDLVEDFGGGNLHRRLHQTIFSGTYADASDPQTLLETTLDLCELESLETDIAALDGQSQHAKREGDQARVQQLQIERLALRRRQQELLERRRRS
jgi:DNA primase